MPITNLTRLLTALLLAVQLATATNACAQSSALPHSAAAPIGINRYDDWGVPAATNMGRFQYSRGTRRAGGTGSPETQAWLPELGMYHYKARIFPDARRGELWLRRAWPPHRHLWWRYRFDHGAGQLPRLNRVSR